MTNQDNRRILLIDDNEDIHRDFRKILDAGGAGHSSGLSDAEGALFGNGDEHERTADTPTVEFEIHSALQGQAALELVKAGLERGEPFALAFVDMRMPPGWDGVETIRRIWEVDAGIQVVICTAFADYTWSEMVGQLGRTDKLLILKKPFDAIEVCQLSLAMTEKWNATRREIEKMEEIVRAEAEARAYASSLEMVNRALEVAKTSAEAAASAHSEFLVSMTGGILDPMTELVDRTEKIRTLDAHAEGWSTLVESICADGGRLASTLRDVLDLSEIEAGTMSLAAQPCSPSVIAEGVCAKHLERARANGLELTVECAADAPGQVVSDEARLERVLDHLVANAVTYTNTGSVSVTVRAGGPHAGQALFEVIDSGPGLSPADRAHLFENFCHMPGTTGASNGAGLGLSLSKRLTLALGGEFEIETSDAGTRVTLAVGDAVPLAT